MLCRAGILYVGLAGYRSSDDQYPATTLIASKIKLRRPAQAIYEHKIWALLDIDQVMIDIQSWRETLTSDDETSRGMLVEFSLFSVFCDSIPRRGRIRSRYFAQTETTAAHFSVNYI